MKFFNSQSEISILKVFRANTQNKIDGTTMGEIPFVTVSNYSIFGGSDFSESHVKQPGFVERLKLLILSDYKDGVGNFLLWKHGV